MGIEAETPLPPPPQVPYAVPSPPQSPYLSTPPMMYPQQFTAVAAGEVQILPKMGSYLFDENEYSLHLQPFITQETVQGVLNHINSVVHSATKIPNLLSKITIVTIFISMFSVFALSLTWAFAIYYWLLPTIFVFVFIILVFFLVLALTFLRMWLVSRVKSTVSSLEPYIEDLNNQFSANGVRFKLTTELIFSGYSRRSNHTRLVPKLIIEFNSSQRVV